MLKGIDANNNFDHYILHCSNTARSRREEILPRTSVEDFAESNLEYLLAFLESERFLQEPPRNIRISNKCDRMYF